MTGNNPVITVNLRNGERRLLGRSLQVGNSLGTCTRHTTQLLASYFARSSLVAALVQLNKADGLVTIQAAWLINSQMDQPMVWAYAELASGYVRAVGKNLI